MSDFHKTNKWREKSEKIIKRDKYCQNCKRYGRIRNAQMVHHIKPVEDYPELGFVNSNLVALCWDCHNKMHPEKARKALKKRFSGRYY